MGPEDGTICSLRKAGSCVRHVRLITCIVATFSLLKKKLNFFKKKVANVSERSVLSSGKA